jgi:hypothetical protein
MPSGLVAAVFVVRVPPTPPGYPETAHHIPSSGAHTADDQMFEVIAAFVKVGAGLGLGIARTFVEAAVT